MARAKKAADGEPTETRGRSTTRTTTGAKAPRRSARQRRREEAASGALSANAAALAPHPPEVAALVEAIAADGGTVIGAYREPLAGRPLIAAVLPLDLVQPTPYQRTVSPAHVLRLADAMTRTGLYLDPIIAFREAQAANGGAPYHTPNGGHRLEALRKMGAKAVTALVVPDTNVAFRILALNTEKAHNLRERALEVARMAHALAPLGGRESDYAPYFEEPSLLTMGLAYEEHGRLSGAAYHPIVKRLESWSDAPLAQAIELRGRHARDVLALDEKVGAVALQLKARGLQSPYLRAFVVARINPLRFAGRGKGKEGAAPPDWSATFEKMNAALARFDATKVEPHDLAGAGGPPADDGE